jgi:hypothetical protein
MQLSTDASADRSFNGMLDFSMLNYATESTLAKTPKTQRRASGGELRAHFDEEPMANCMVCDVMDLAQILRKLLPTANATAEQSAPSRSQGG